MTKPIYFIYSSAAVSSLSAISIGPFLSGPTEFTVLNFVDFVYLLVGFNAKMAYLWHKYNITVRHLSSFLYFSIVFSVRRLLKLWKKLHPSVVSSWFRVYSFLHR